MRAFRWAAAVAGVALSACVADAGGVAGTEQEIRDEVLDCDVLVVGRSLGAVAAAHEAASRGARTCLITESSWLGGQLVESGVPPDEAFLDFSTSYGWLRSRIRQMYLSGEAGYVVDPADAQNEPGETPPGFDPGSCWLTGLCHEPRISRAAVEELLAPLVAGGQLIIRRGYRPTALFSSGSRVTGASFQLGTAFRIRLFAEARVTIDATEHGDLLPYLGPSSYRTGEESFSMTGEPDAPTDPRADCVQPFTFTFALERMPDGEDHSMPAPPPGYDPAHYQLVGFDAFFGEKPAVTSFWAYRRMLHAPNFTAGVPNDVALINYGGHPIQGGNDFDRGCGPDGCNVIDRPPAVADAILQRGRDHALGFAYFLQHDVPRPGSPPGYRNLRLRPDVLGTADGLSRFPYIRESRRLVALTLIREQDAGFASSGPMLHLRAPTRYSDSLGVSRYGFDLHWQYPCAPAPGGGLTYHAAANQIPLGALIPVGWDGFLAGAKNIGTTHITNGAYRVHPSEWNVGLAAGATAATAAAEGIQPRQIRADVVRLRRLQLELVRGRGGPIHWTGNRMGITAADPRPVHVLRGDREYEAAQMLGVAGVMVGFPDLPFRPQDTMTRGIAAVLIVTAFGIPGVPPADCRSVFTDVPCTHPFYGAIQALYDRSVTAGIGGGLFGVNDPIPRSTFAVFMVRAACDPVWNEELCPLASPPSPTFSDVPTTHLFYGYIETAHARGWIAGDVPAGGSFRPNDTTTRGDTALWLWAKLRIALGL